MSDTAESRYTGLYTIFQFVVSTMTWPVSSHGSASVISPLFATVTR